MGFCRNFERSWSTKKTTLFRSGFFVSNILRKVVDLTILNILRTTRAMLINFCIINTPRGQIPICRCKVFCLFQHIFFCGNVNSNTTKRQKTSAFKHFLLLRYSKNELHSEIKSPSQPHTPPRSTPHCYSGVIRVKTVCFETLGILGGYWEF